MGGACSAYVEKRSKYRVLLRKPKGKNHLGDPDVDGRIILKWIFRKCIWEVGLDRIGCGWGQVNGTCECGNEPSGSIN
jgi:hypothetical protein